MRYEVTHGPVFSKLDVDLDAQESIIAQPNSMLSMTTGFEVTARMGGQMDGGGGLGKGLKSLLTGESLFAAIFTAKRDGQRLSLAPDLVGDIVPLPMNGEEYFITRGAFLACTPTITLTAKYGGLKGWMAKTGIFLMQASGSGLLLVATNGALVSQTLAPEERLIVDNRYVIAFQTTVQFELVKVTESIRHSMLSGEGLVNRYTGPGTVYYQTRARPRASMMREMLTAFT
jgi:uncharacterized protein (TIGR00266 family)